METSKTAALSRKKRTAFTRVQNCPPNRPSSRLGTLFLALQARIQLGFDENAMQGE